MERNNKSNKVALWVRGLAGLYMVCTSYAAWHIVQQPHAELEFSIQAYLVVLIETLLFAYITLLFFYVAVTGNTPVKFFPLATMRLPWGNPSNRSAFRKFGVRFHKRER